MGSLVSYFLQQRTPFKAYFKNANSDDYFHEGPLIDPAE